MRLQARVAGHRERRTALLYAMSRELAATRGQEAMARVAVRHVSEVFDSQVVVLLPDAGRPHARIRAARASPARCTAPTSASRNGCRTTARPPGLGTDTLPGAEALYLPLPGLRSAVLGVLGVLPANPRRVLLPEQFHLLETFAGQIALALERAQLAEHAQRASIDAETEGLRNALLASISHDLRTPLAVIAGASSQPRRARRAAARRPSAPRSRAASYEQSRQMTQLVTNMLEMTRLEAGAHRARARLARARRDRRRGAAPAAAERLAAHPVARGAAGATCRWCASTRR